jgi:hypothetical protein
MGGGETVAKKAKKSKVPQKGGKVKVGAGSKKGRGED